MIFFFSTGKTETKSVTDYNADVSGGKIAFNGEVVGPFRAPLKKTEYAHGSYERGSELSNVQALAPDALAAAKSQFSLRFLLITTAMAASTPSS